MPVIYLTQTELARRWRISPRTLERWREGRRGARQAERREQGAR
jgi:hypothetical protein